MIQANESKCLNFEKLLEFIFCLSRSTAPIERVFSVVKTLWSDIRNRPLIENTKSFPQIKI